jgi:hypothetical protein
MARNARDSARSLELIIRAAAAEERLLGRRLERITEAQRRARASAENGNGHRPPDLQEEEGSSER